MKGRLQDLSFADVKKKELFQLNVWEEALHKSWTEVGSLRAVLGKIVKWMLIRCAWNVLKRGDYAFRCTRR